MNDFIYKPIKSIIPPKGYKNKYLVHSNYSFKKVSNQAKAKSNNDDISNTFLISYKIKGQDKKYSQVVRALPFTNSTKFTNLLVSRKSNSNKFEFLEHDHKNKLIYLKKGNWIIDRPLILPNGYKLIANSGVLIELLDGAYIFVSASVNLLGNEYAPIIIKGAADWL